MKNHKIISEIFHHAVEEKRDVKNPSPNTWLGRKPMKRGRTGNTPEQ